MVQIHFRKVTILLSTNLYEVLENVEHPSDSRVKNDQQPMLIELPVWCCRRLSSHAMRLHAWVHFGKYPQDLAGICTMYVVKMGVSALLLQECLCTVIMLCGVVWGSDLILLQWCSSTFAPVGSTYESARDANMSPGSSGGSKFTLPLQVNFCAFPMESFAPLQMQKDGGAYSGCCRRLHVRSCGVT